MEDNIHSSAVASAILVFPGLTYGIKAVGDAFSHILINSMHPEALSYHLVTPTACVQAAHTRSSRAHKECAISIFTTYVHRITKTCIPNERQTSSDRDSILSDVPKTSFKKRKEHFDVRHLLKKKKQLSCRLPHLMPTLGNNHLNKITPAIAKATT